VSWVWLLPLGLGALAAGGLWAALRALRREIEGLARATATLAVAADRARSARIREGS